MSGDDQKSPDPRENPDPRDQDDLDQRLQGGESSGAGVEERREGAFRSIKRSEDLQDFLERANKGKKGKIKRACPACGSKNYEARSTQNYLLYRCRDCGQKWEALVQPNTVGPRIPEDPMQKVLDNLPRHRDPRKVRSVPDE